MIVILERFEEIYEDLAFIISQFDATAHFLQRALQIFDHFVLLRQLILHLFLKVDDLLIRPLSKLK